MLIIGQKRNRNRRPTKLVWTCLSTPARIAPVTNFPCARLRQESRVGCASPLHIMFPPPCAKSHWVDQWAYLLTTIRQQNLSYSFHAPQILRFTIRARSRTGEIDRLAQHSASSSSALASDKAPEMSSDTVGSNALWSRLNRGLNQPLIPSWPSSLALFSSGGEYFCRIMCSNSSL